MLPEQKYVEIQSSCSEILFTYSISEVVWLKHSAFDKVCYYLLTNASGLSSVLPLDWPLLIALSKHTWICTCMFISTQKLCDRARYFQGTTNLLQFNICDPQSISPCYTRNAILIKCQSNATETFDDGWHLEQTHKTHCPWKCLHYVVYYKVWCFVHRSYIFWAIKEENKFNFCFVSHLLFPSIKVVFISRKTVNEKLVSSTSFHSLHDWPEKNDTIILKYTPWLTLLAESQMT